MQLATLISRAASDTGAVLRAVRPAQLAAPTPCAEWDVRTLVNHVLQVSAALALAGRGGPVPSELWTRELAGDDVAERFDADVAVAAVEWPAAPILLGTYEMPAASVAAMLVCDLAIHGWDLARATVPVAPDAGAFDALLAASGRDPGWEAV
jgi:uncharacterized protein (TIGR03086 family)